MVRRSSVLALPICCRGCPQRRRMWVTRLRSRIWPVGHSIVRRTRAAFRVKRRPKKTQSWARYRRNGDDGLLRGRFSGVGATIQLDRCGYRAPRERPTRRALGGHRGRSDKGSICQRIAHVRRQVSHLIPSSEADMSVRRDLANFHRDLIAAECLFMAHTDEKVRFSERTKSFQKR
jgi:hypothetical protein